MKNHLAFKSEYQIQDGSFAVMNNNAWIDCNVNFLSSLVGKSFCYSKTKNVQKVCIGVEKHIFVRH